MQDPQINRSAYKQLIFESFFFLIFVTSTLAGWEILFTCSAVPSHAYLRFVLNIEAG